MRQWPAGPGPRAAGGASGCTGQRLWTRPRATELGTEPPPLASSGAALSQDFSPDHRHCPLCITGVFSSRKGIYDSFPNILISTVFEYSCLDNCHW